MEFQAVVLAAGRGSRMTDLTSRTPKALLPVANRPMVTYPIKMLEKAGFEEAIIVVPETALANIQKALTEVCEVKMRLDFVAIPAAEDWGTADTLRHIKDKIMKDLLVVSCDLITDVAVHRLADLHRTYDASVTMLLAPAPDTADMAAPGGKASKKIERDIVGLDESGVRVLFLSSEADFEESISFKKSFFKKHPNVLIGTKLTDGHLYLLKRWVLDLLTQDRTISTVKGELVPMLVRKQFTSSRPKAPEKEGAQADLSVVSLNATPDLYSLSTQDDTMKLAQQMSTWIDHRGDMQDCFHGDKIRCYAHVVTSGLCLRANTLVTYCEANRQVPKQLSALMGTDPDVKLPLIHPAASIQQKSQVGSDSMVGEGTTMAERVGVKRSTIGHRCSIGEKVKVTNSVLFDHVTIMEGCTLTGCVICPNVHIAEKCELKDCLVGANQNIMSMGKFTNEVIVDLDRMMEI